MEQVASDIFPQFSSSAGTSADQVSTAIKDLQKSVFDVKSAYEVLFYSEVSSITFDLPRYVDGVETPRYKDVIGTHIVEMDGWGQFILMDPSTDNDGIQDLRARRLC